MFESKLTAKVKTLSAIAASIDATLQKAWIAADNVPEEKSEACIQELLSEYERSKLVDTLLLDTAVEAMKDIDKALDKILKEKF